MSVLRPRPRAVVTVVDPDPALTELPDETRWFEGASAWADPPAGASAHDPDDSGVAGSERPDPQSASPSATAHGRVSRRMFAGALLLGALAVVALVLLAQTLLHATSRSTNAPARRRPGSARLAVASRIPAHRQHRASSSARSAGHTSRRRLRPRPAGAPRRRPRPSASGGTSHPPIRRQAGPGSRVPVQRHRIHHPIEQYPIHRYPVAQHFADQYSADQYSADQYRADGPPASGEFGFER